MKGIRVFWGRLGAFMEATIFSEPLVRPEKIESGRFWKDILSLSVW